VDEELQEVRKWLPIDEAVAKKLGVTVQQLLMWDVAYDNGLETPDGLYWVEVRLHMPIGKKVELPDLEILYEQGETKERE
jgi:hypothetical protein